MTAAAALPGGTVTMFFTDIEGSTRDLRSVGTDEWEKVLEAHAQIIREAVGTRRGTIVRTAGDSFFVVFTTPRDALGAAVAAQRGLARLALPGGAPVRVRMGIHTGEARPASDASGVDYVGFEVHRAARIAAAAHGGQILISETTAALVRDQLSDGVSLRDLGEHRFKDLTRPERIYQVAANGLLERFPPIRSLDAIRNNLPTQMTSFVGRERDLAAADAALAKHRLVTLTGPGGSGKTRLALQVAADSADAYRGGAWLVELAPVSEPSAVAPAIVAALRLTERSGRPAKDALVEALRADERLLVLDNCEHLVAMCAELAAEILRSCPGVRILATSREGLGVPGEALMPVPPLRVPDPDVPLTPERLEAYESIRLFVERAASFQPDFALTSENAAEVVRICRRLDGVPLALELAAARVRAMSVADIANRLDDRFRLLTGGARTVVARQQTLRAMIDWSHDLLSGPERVLFRRFAVFVDGWTLEAAEAVCSGDDLARESVVDVLTGLIDKSLVVLRERRGTSRYAMLESMREYALERLIDSGEVERLRKRQFEYFFALVDGVWNRGVAGTDYFPTGLEWQNLRASFEWILAEPEGAQSAMHFAGSMISVAAYLGRISELRGLLQRALSRVQDYPQTPARARATLALANIAAMDGKPDEALALATEAADGLRAIGDKRALAQALMVKARAQIRDVATASATIGEARALLEELGDVWGLALFEFILADVAMTRGDYGPARRGHAAAIAMFDRAGHHMMATSPMLSLARIACAEGDFPRARKIVEEVVAVRREHALDGRWHLAIALNSLGEIARCEGDPSGGAPSFEEALRYARELGDDPITAWSLHNLAHVAMAEGDLGLAASRFRESLLLRSQASPINVAEGIAGLAGVALRAGLLSDAARLMGSAEEIAESNHMVLGPADAQVWRRDRELLTERLDGAAFASAIAAGRRASRDEMFELANGFLLEPPRRTLG